MKSIQWSRSSISLLAISSLLFAILIAPSASSQGSYDDCVFGKSQDVGESDDFGNYTMPDGSVYNRTEDSEKYSAPDGTIVDYGSWGICAPTLWVSRYRDDGFTKKIEIDMRSDSYMRSDSDEGTVTITCENKELRVAVYFNFDYSIYVKGGGQYKIDSGKTVNFEARGYYSLEKPKTFVTALAKAKVKFTFKVLDKARVFPKGDFLTYRTKFAKLGCKF